jgi:hypothetical protein
METTFLKDIGVRRPGRASTIRMLTAKGAVIACGVNRVLHGLELDLRIRSDCFRAQPQYSVANAGRHTCVAQLHKGAP